MTPAPSLLAPTSAASFADRFWALAPGPETLDVPEPLRTVVIVRHFLAVLDALARGPRKAVPAIGAMLRASEIDGCSSYASPEQLRGEPLDTRSVVFSLGVVLFEKLAGRHPFGAENNRPRQITRIQRGEMGSGVNSFPTIAASVRSVLVRAMNPFSEERWPDLRPMRDLLEQFLATDAPHPRLPGTAASDDLPAEPTRVVRRATDFGRELMDVVARHERPESPSPKALRPASWPAAAADAPARPARPTPPPTPRLGVTALRPPAPRRLVPAVSEDSVITRIDPARIDPLGATLRVTMERAAAEAANDDDSQSSITAPLPSPASVVPGAIESLPSMAPDRLEVSVSTDSLAAPPPVPPPRPRRTFTVPPTARPHSEPVPDLRVASRSKTLLVAFASAAIGAGAATLAVVALRPDAPPTSPTIAPPSPPAAEPVETSPAPPPPPPAAAASAPAPAPSPSAVPSDDPAARLHAAIAPCIITDTHRVFGISVVARGAGSKAYFGPADGLTPAERSCISNAVKPLGDMPTEAGYKIRVDATGLAVTLR